MSRRRAVAALALGLALGLACGPSWAAGERLPVGLQTRPSDDGLALVDADGRGVYRLDLDRYRSRRGQAGPLIAARCAEVCDQLWRPVAVPPSFKPSGDWGIAATPQHPPQLTYKGDPLYSFIGKSLAVAAEAPVAPPYFTGYAAKPSELHEGVPTATVYWHAALYAPPAPEVPSPAGISLRLVKGRYVFAEASGRGLYAPSAGGTCAASCVALEPLAAPLAAQPVGAWRPIHDKDGARVWSYRGRLVYRAVDAEPPPGSGAQPLVAR